MAPKKQAAKKEVEPKKKETKTTKGVEKKTKAKKEPTKAEPKSKKTPKSPKKAEKPAAPTEAEAPAKKGAGKKSAPKKETKPKAEKPAKKATPKAKAADKDKVAKPKAVPKTKKEPKSPKKEVKEPKSPKKEPKSPKSPKKAAENKENGKAETKKEAKSGDKLEVGQPIFEFELESDESTDSTPVTVSITDVLNDNGVVLFFYPKANTPGCTKQACGFRDDYENYATAGYKIFGVSADKPKSQKSWKEKQGFQYSLLSDPNFEVLSKLGVSSGKKITRSHIIIEKGNTIKDISINVKPDDSVKNARATVL